VAQTFRYNCRVRARWHSLLGSKTDPLSQRGFGRGSVPSNDRFLVNRRSTAGTGSSRGCGGSALALVMLLACFGVSRLGRVA
jgi:hypothetical protein